MSYRCDSSELVRSTNTTPPEWRNRGRTLSYPERRTPRGPHASPFDRGKGASRSTREYPSRERSYQAEHTRSYPNTEVKQPRAWLVLGWETTMEFHVLFALSLSFNMAGSLAHTSAATRVRSPRS